MKKRIALLLAVLLVVSLLTACQSIIEGIFSDAAGELGDRLETMEPYPLYLDQRIEFGMTEAEVQAVLGHPKETSALSTEDTISLPVVCRAYDWTVGGFAGSLKLMFLNDNLYDAELTILCAPEERQALLTELKRMADDAYGTWPEYEWKDMTQNITEEIGYIAELAEFDVLQGETGLHGAVLGFADQISVSCMAV